MGSSDPRKFALLAFGLVGFLSVGACGGSDGETVSTPVDEGTTALGSSVVVVDVRTPAEFAAGHLDGAVNIDVQGTDFDAKIGELDPGASYVVYCRSGNRSGVAVDRMAELGITDAVNAGSLESAAEFTNLDIVI